MYLLYLLLYSLLYFRYMSEDMCHCLHVSARLFPSTDEPLTCLAVLSVPSAVILHNDLLNSSKGKEESSIYMIVR